MEQYTANLNWFDITLISIILISTIFAMFRGLIKAVFSLITWVCSGSIALYLYPFSREIIATKIHNEKLVVVIASLGVFLVVFIILAIINGRIVHVMRKQSGGFIDRTLGLGFGAARGVLIVCLIFFSISLTSKMLHLGKNPDRPGPQWFVQASTYEVLDMASTGLLAFAPTDMPDKLEQTVTKFKDITLSAMGEELEESSGTTKTLSDEQRKLMKQIIASLSPEDLGEVYKKYDSNPSTLSEFEKIEIFRDIIAMYKNRVKEDKIPADKIVTEENVQMLEDSLGDNKLGATTGISGDLGYKDRNIKQLDRLVEGVQ